MTLQMPSSAIFPFPKAVHGRSNAKRSVAPLVKSCAAAAEGELQEPQQRQREGGPHALMAVGLT